jgi:hypothetical protein
MFQGKPRLRNATLKFKAEGPQKRGYPPTTQKKRNPKLVAVYFENHIEHMNTLCGNMRSER